METRYYFIIIFLSDRSDNRQHTVLVRLLPRVACISTASANIIGSCINKRSQLHVHDPDAQQSDKSLEKHTVTATIVVK